MYGKQALYYMIDIYLDPDLNFAGIVAYNSKFEEDYIKYAWSLI